jgi:hypothetical protein
MTISDNIGRGGAIKRREYLIDRFRVVFESGGGWQCVCPAFLSSNSCRHSREAAGMRAAQAKIKDSVATGRSQLRAKPGRSVSPGP